MHPSLSVDLLHVVPMFEARGVAMAMAMPAQSRTPLVWTHPHSNAQHFMIMTPPSRLPLLAFIGVFLLFTSTVSLCSAHVFDNPLSWEQRFRAPTETVASTCAQASAWNTHLAALSCLAPQRRKRHLEMHQAHCGVSATRWSQMTQKGPSSLCKLNAAKC